jgi:hypothetical protein
LVLGVKFRYRNDGVHVTLELAHLAILHTWNAEISLSITGLSGTVIGLFVGQKNMTKSKPWPNEIGKHNSKNLCKQNCAAFYR